MATSGNYERYVVINGRHYAHIMNPKTGRPVENMLSVTVVTPRAVDSDALSTSVFIKGAKFAEKVVAEFPRTSVLIIKRNPQTGTVYSKGFGKIFK
ncbi:MAG: FAD:protein FMN transferase [Kiritimatiellaeota bacterium]|nr:FAD:protein FMN transferase [Kiritimatiellota bacterium]